jgi:hypothetical protein
MIDRCVGRVTGGVGLSLTSVGAAAVLLDLNVARRACTGLEADWLGLAIRSTPRRRGAELSGRDQEHELPR